MASPTSVALWTALSGLGAIGIVQLVKRWFGLETEKRADDLAQVTEAKLEHRDAERQARADAEVKAGTAPIAAQTQAAPTTLDEAITEAMAEAVKQDPKP